MSGNSKGGVKATHTTKQRHGDDFYVKIGALGGSKSRNGGFAQNRELAREAGRIGGKRSRRGAIERLKDQEARKEIEHSMWKESKGL